MKAKKADGRIVMPAMLRPDDPAYELERYAPLHAAEYLGLSVDQVRREVAARRMGHRRTGTRGEITMSQGDLDRWRQARRTEVALSPADVRRATERQPLHHTRRSVLPMPKDRRFAVR